MSHPERPARSRSRPLVALVLDLEREAIATQDRCSFSGEGALASLADLAKRGRQLALRSPRAELEQALEASTLHRNHDVAQIMRIACARAGWETDLLDPELPPVPRCRLHLFAAVGERVGDVSTRSLLALLEIASFEQIPVVVHALVGGSGGPRSAADSLLRLEELLGDQGTIGTLSGIDALDLSASDDPWSGLLSFHRAVVLGDAPTATNWYEALSSGYDRDLDDRAIPPIRLGAYVGVRGNLSVEFGSVKRQWAWVGEDVGLILDLGDDRVGRLGALLSRSSSGDHRGLPEPVLAELTERGRTISAFDPDSLRSLVSSADDHAVFAAYSVARPLDIVTRLLERAGGAHWTVHAASAAETARAMGELARALDRAEHDLLVAHLADPCERQEHRDESNRSLLQIANAVRQRGGALVVTTSARAPGELAPLLLVDDHHDYGELHTEASIEDLAATLLDLLELPPHDAWDGRDLRKLR
jgi:hypothetical protein